MSRIIWKENKVISIETRKGVFVLAQMIKSPYIVFFNCFKENNDFDKIDLQNTQILFTHAVTRQFLKKSNIETLKIEPLKNYQPPKLWIKEDASSRMVNVWKGTKNEREFITFGENGAILIEKDILKDNRHEDSNTVFDKCRKKLIPKNIKLNDIKDYELTSVEIYPNLNERLFLCYLTGENIDPAKNILFNIEMPLEYERYVDIISGKIPLEKLGY